MTAEIRNGGAVQKSVTQQRLGKHDQATKNGNKRDAAG
jgi:hypothetical protein